MQHWHENKKAGLASSKVLGNTNTNQDISNLTVNLGIDWDTVSEDTTFLEPAVGMGSFYQAIADRLLEKGFSKKHVFGHQLTALDIDPDALSRCKDMIAKRYGQEAADIAQLNHIDFWGQFWPKERYDIIITNPPYVSAKRIEPPKGQDKEEWYKSACVKLAYPPMPRADIYSLFHTKCLELLKPKGVCVFLCSDSWIDSDFGDTLKSMILDGEWALRTVINSQLTPFFRDDTNAIITVIQRLTAKRDDAGKNSTTKNTEKSNKADKGDKPGKRIEVDQKSNLERGITEIQNWRSPVWGKTNQTQITHLTPSQLDDALRGITHNKRNAFLLFSHEHEKAQNLLREPYFRASADIFDIKTSSVGASWFDKDKQGHSKTGNTPVFWQLQARTNRKPDYRTHVPAKDLTLWVDETLPGPSGKPLPLVSNALFLSTIVDRFPLVFWTDRECVHVNKYVSLTPRNNNPLWASAAALESIPAILSMEQSSKEGTRKTLRKGEFGLAKEMSKSDISNILIPSIEAFEEFETSILSYQSRVIYNLEDAIKDDDYWSIQNQVAKILGYQDRLLEMTKLSVFLYVLRMRHLEKLSDFDAWYEREHGERLRLGMQ